MIYNREFSQAEILAISGYHPMQVTTWNLLPASSSLQFHVQADSFSSLSDNTVIGTPWKDVSNNVGFDMVKNGNPIFRTGANGINGKAAQELNLTIL